MSSQLILKRNRSCTFPVFRTKLLDLADLNLILDHEIKSSKSSNMHLHSGTDLGVIVMSSMEALVGDWRIPKMLIGPRVIFSAFSTHKFIAAEKRMTEIVQPVTILTSRRCHDVV
ncbi:hypothetical protein DPMN_105826 [Dreissena polymorpha]|uniref:Uncharacterized protein n=1 Tax=Dreissena polymorpha TaxID=45954 RepID=A0A9D4K3W0_DREPO|nr:hypothetical protein DPMN_105826 [Dreissena polymorpha]